MELKLLKLRFKHLTAEMREVISKSVKEHRCSDTSDIVIDVLWRECKDDLIAMLRYEGGLSSAQFVDLQLSAPTRETVRTWLEQALQHEAELGDLDDKTFEAYYREVMAPIVYEKRARRASRAEENDRWDFFSTVEAEADFQRWRDKPLSPAQAVALSLGKEPDVVTPEKLKPYHTPGGSPFRERFSGMLELIEGAIGAGELATPILIKDFIPWAKERDFDLPPELTGKPRDIQTEDASLWKEKFEAAQAELKWLRRNIDELNAKSVDSVYKMIFGMAVARFEHRTDQRSVATSAIMAACEQAGVPLGDDAIREHLKDAATHLDIQWTTPIRWTGVRKPQR